MTLKNKIWSVKNNNSNKSIIDKLLLNRDLISQDKIDEFFNLKFPQSFHDPFLMKDIQKAISRISSAINNKEKIIIFGDYDVDGITATAILFHALQSLGATVSYRLPHRVNDGYGLNKNFIDEFQQIGVSLIITVDCGISGASEVNYALGKGIDTIITDHHTVPFNFPDKAYAVIMPRQADCPYPYKELTGAGIAFKLSHALFASLAPDNVIPALEKYLDLACLGTIADCAPLTDENRSIVKFGLERLQKTDWFGLQYLKKQAGLKDDALLDVYSVGFYLAPRLNAAGRIANPYYSLQLLLNGKTNGEKLASHLEKINQDRQHRTKTSLEQITEMFGKDLDKEKIIIAHHPDFHIGIVGLVAGRLAEKYYRPAIIMEERGEMLYASARSPEYFSIIDALTHVQEHLYHFGGHSQAAGCTVKKEKLPAFIAALQKYAEEKINTADLKPILNIDCELKANDLNFETLSSVEKFAPFGEGNPKPVFLLQNAEIFQLKNVGKESQHLKFRLRLKNNSQDAIGFSMGEFRDQLKEYQKVDLAFELADNVWNGERSLQLKVEDIKVGN